MFSQPDRGVMLVPVWLETTKAISELAAFTSAAIFFVYKAATGYLLVNVSLSATTDRVHVDKEWDQLSIAATLEKGSNGSMEIHEAKARASWTGDCQELPLVGI